MKRLLVVFGALALLAGAALAALPRVLAWAVRVGVAAGLLWYLALVARSVG